MYLVKLQNWILGLAIVTGVICFSVEEKQTNFHLQETSQLIEKRSNSNWAVFSFISFKRIDDILFNKAEFNFETFLDKYNTAIVSSFNYCKKSSLNFYQTKKQSLLKSTLKHSEYLDFIV